MQRKKPRHFWLWIDRTISGKPWNQIKVAALIFLGCLLLVCLGYLIVKFKSDRWKSIAEAFVDMVSPVTIHTYAYDKTYPLTFWGAIGYVFVYFIGVIFFTGVLVATITNILRTRADRFKAGTVKYKFKGHIVFLGYDDMIVGMILKLCKQGEEYGETVRIVVGVEDNVHGINDKIKNRLYGKYKNNVVVLQADGCNRTDLEKRIRVPYAERVYIIGEHDDAYNLKSYRTIYELSLCSKEKDFDERMPECYVNLRHKSTLKLFQTYATAGDIGVDFSKFHVFNFYDEWARYMIVGENLDSEKRIDRDGNPTKQIHLVIVGMTEMGIALARQAMLWCHYPNGIKTKITFIDPQADLYSKFFIGSHQQLFKNHTKNCHYSCFNFNTYPGLQKKSNSELDIEFEFYKSYISDDDIRKEIVEWATDENQFLTIAICLPKAAQSFGAAIYLPDELFSEKDDESEKTDKQERTSVPIWVYQPTYGDMGNYLSGSHYKNVITFGMSGESLDICNEDIINKAKFINHYIKNRTNGVVKYNNPRWIDAEWQALGVKEKWTNINRAGLIAEKSPKADKFDNLTEKEINNLAEVELKRLQIEELIVSGKVSTTKKDIEFIKELKEIKEIAKYL